MLLNNAVRVQLLLHRPLHAAAAAGSAACARLLLERGEADAKACNLRYVFDNTSRYHACYQQQCTRKLDLNVA
jgi:ankyrin repeat protein